LGLRGKLRRLEHEAHEKMIEIPQQDGTVARFPQSAAACTPGRVSAPAPSARTCTGVDLDLEVAHQSAPSRVFLGLGAARRAGIAFFHGGIVRVGVQRQWRNRAKNTLFEGCDRSRIRSNFSAAVSCNYEVGSRALGGQAPLTASSETSGSEWPHSRRLGRMAAGERTS
jgi:hypothetical protein